MKKILFSIITPSYNQGRYIEQTIQSVLTQDYPFVEYIVMDGGSTDKTVSILKKYKNKLKWFSQKDRGQSDAINKGIKLAQGNVIAWLNSDDYYLPGTLKKVADFFMMHRDILWTSGDYRIIDEAGRNIHSLVVQYKRLLRSFSSYALLSCVNYIVQPSTFWSSTIVQKIGILNENYKYCMDYDLWLRIYKKYPLRFLHSPLSCFRIHKESKGTKEFEKQFSEELSILKRHKIPSLWYGLHSIHNNAIKLIYKHIK